MRFNLGKWTLLLMAATLALTCRAEANYYTDYFNENVLKVTPTEEIKIAAALGIGSHANSISLKDDRSEYTLQTTNRNLYLLGISVNDRTQFLLQIPFKDPAESRASRVDSDVRLYSASYNWTSELSSTVSFFRNKGYMLENFKGTKTSYVLPSISVDKYSAMLSYTSNKEHQSIFIDPIIYKKNKDSSAWITTLGFDHTDITNLGEINVLPLLRKSMINSAHVDTLVARLAYSKNWFWKNWYATVAGGVGLHSHVIKASSDTAQITEFHTPIDILLSMSMGYVWTRFSSGAFLNAEPSRYQFENIDLTTNFGNMGIFVSYQF